MQSKSSGGALPIVLVVDDEEPVRTVQRRVLESDGYQVLEATNGIEGVAMLTGGAVVDLLIADLEMTLLGGDGMVRKIRGIRPDLRVLYVTGNIDRLMDARPLWEGEAFLEKPFSAAGLREAFALLLTGRLAKKAAARGTKS